MAIQKKVEKMVISPEEIAVVNNIKALIDELLTMGAQNEEMVAEPEMLTEEKQIDQTDHPPEDEEEIGKEEVIKGIEETTSDGSTANDDAGIRDDGNKTDINEETVDEVTKALMQLIKQKKTTQKSVSNNNNNIAPVLNELTKVIKSMNNRQEETEKALESILKGLGVAEAIQKDETEKIEKSKPIRSNKELEKVLEYVLKTIGSDKQVEKESENKTYAGNTNQNALARKSIASFLPGLIQGDK